jgi:beta-phosphoglucomutase-like phosphatase (HAD superfamily)
MPAGPRALIFDCDGVIADDEHLHLAAFQRALAPAGITIARDAYYARYLGLNDREAIRLAFDDAGVPAPAERVAAAAAAKADAFLALVRAGAPIFPGVVPFVRAAAGACRSRSHRARSATRSTSSSRTPGSPIALPRS